jgi:ribosomal-protein-alanine N-acetyltransferase
VTGNSLNSRGDDNDERIRALTPLTGFTSFPVLETTRLILRETVLTDAEAMFAIFADGEVTRYHDLTTFQSLDEAVGVIERRAKRFADGRGIRWAITRKEDNILIGSCGFGAWVEGHQAEVGYELGRAWWGQGIMTEALQAILSRGFREMRFHRVIADVMVANAASMRVLGRLGFQDEGVYPQEGFWKGQYHDLRRFALDLDTFAEVGADR